MNSDPSPIGKGAKGQAAILVRSAGQQAVMNGRARGPDSAQETGGGTGASWPPSGGGTLTSASSSEVARP